MTSVQEASGSRLFWLIVLAIFFPPASIWIEFGFFSRLSLANVLLTVLLPLVGFIHAVYYLCKERYRRNAQGDYEAIPTANEVSDPVSLPAQADNSASVVSLAQPLVASSSTVPTSPDQSSAPGQPIVNESSSAPPPYSHDGSAAMDNKVQSNT